MAQDKNQLRDSSEESRVSKASRERIILNIPDLNWDNDDEIQAFADALYGDIVKRILPKNE
ncbi:MAG: hypothetical protein F2839_04055 [Actinobacteria bacterium]|uniref:Unannotated protein n=1 Tax=freshwater metagenome TaxID=449393 RepID=A0A6J5ZFX0_9ZZZZ|nr:hypothetical protein [Actinomycetota bacterium]